VVGEVIDLFMKSISWRFQSALTSRSIHCRRQCGGVSENPELPILHGEKREFSWFVGLTN
jgi:hypothetical protein